MNTAFENIMVHWEHFDPKIALLVFVSYFVLDALFAKYTLDVGELNEYRSATTGAVTHFFLAFGVITYTQNYLYIFPLALGSWIGTFYYVRRARFKKLNEN